MLDLFGADELWAHCNSSRVVCRGDPYTPDVWQYKDTQAWRGSLTVGRGSKWQEGHEMEPGEEEAQEFDKLYNQEAMGLGAADISGGFGKGSKGLGKGSGKTKGKGKGFGKGKGSGQLAIKDKEEEEEEDEKEKNEDAKMKEALKKARKARDQVASAQNDLEEALGKASPKLSQKGKAGAQGWATSLGKELVELKAILNGKKVLKSESLKKLLEDTAKLVKGAKDEAKELRQLANKEASVAPSKRSRK